MSRRERVPQVGVDFSPPRATRRSWPTAIVALPYFIAAGAIIGAVIELLLR